MKVEIGEFGNVYVVKTGDGISLEELKKLPEIIDIVKDHNAVFKLDSHGMWIIKVERDEQLTNN